MTRTNLRDYGATSGILPLRNGVRAGEWLAISGQVGHVDYYLVEGGFEAQMRQAFANMSTVLNAHGGSLDDVVQCNVYHGGDMTDFVLMNDLFLEYFDHDRLPARTAYAVAELPFGALVELDGWAFLGESEPPPSA